MSFTNKFLTFFSFFICMTFDTTLIHFYGMIYKMKVMNMKLLIVEDELSIRELIRMNISRYGYLCECAKDGEEALAMIENNKYDLILLDIMLPKINGYELMEYIKSLKTPVIFITAKSSVKERVLGLHMGADDYLVKPFAIEELMARIESVLRRYHSDMEKINVLDVCIHPKTRKVYKHKEEIILTNREYDLLLFLVQNKNIALFRDTLYEKVWEDAFSEDTRTLDLHIQRLRKKLQWQKVIRTIYKIGYMLEVKE